MPLSARAEGVVVEQEAVVVVGEVVAAVVLAVTRNGRLVEHSSLVARWVLPSGVERS